MLLASHLPNVITVQRVHRFSLAGNPDNNNQTSAYQEEAA